MNQVHNVHVENPSDNVLSDKSEP